jgi:hypothetical protein
VLKPWDSAMKIGKIPLLRQGFKMYCTLITKKYKLGRGIVVFIKQA